MADDKKKIIEDLNEKVTDLSSNLDNLITNLGSRLDTTLRNKLRGLETDANNFINQFEKGQDVTKQLSQKINTIQKEAYAQPCAYRLMDQWIERARITDYITI